MTTSVYEGLVLVPSDPQDASRWDELVDLAPIPDVYYRSGYALASEAAGHGKAIGLILQASRVRMLLPLLLRPISELPFASGERGIDAITPYGYGGILPLSPSEPLTEGDVPLLLKALEQWCQQEGVVSCLIRLHPLLQQESWLGHQLWPNSSLLQYRGPTVGIDLGKWDSERERPMGLHERRRRDLKRAQGALRVSWSGTDHPLAEALTLFRQVYEERMVSLNARSYYFFPTDYYLCLASRLKSHIAIALAWHGCELVGGYLFMADRQFAHYHLGGASELGLELGAPTLLMNAGAQWARSRGSKLLHLGGGVSNSDGLFVFKRSFGGDLYAYHTLQMIADAPHYHDLVERRFRFEPNGQVGSGFFPQYRA